MRKCIKALLVVLSKEAHRLLTHRTLIGISRTLVVIRERDCGGDGSENHTGVNLSVSISGIRLLTDFLCIHRNHRLFSLSGIDILKESLTLRRSPEKKFLPRLTGFNLVK